MCGGGGGGGGGHFGFPVAHWPLEYSVDKNPLALWCHFTCY